MERYIHYSASAAGSEGRGVKQLHAIHEEVDGEPCNGRDKDKDTM